MRRSLSASLGCVLVVAALAGSGCGRYGPPVRAADRAASPSEQTPPSPAAEPEEPADPATPAQEP